MKSIDCSISKLKEKYFNVHPAPRILLVDDDPVFGNIMLEFANQAGLELVFCSDPNALKGMAISRFEVAIIDYDLQNISGIQLSRTLETLGIVLPTLLVSSYPQPVLPGWATSILGFVHKQSGPLEILSQTLGAYLQFIQNGQISSGLTYLD